MGAVGQRKITQWTRYLAVVHRPAAVHRPGLPLPQRRRRPARRRWQHHRPRRAARRSRPFRVLIVVLTLTAGTALLMWLGELITQRGIGNGMSLLIMASVVSGFPAQGATLKAEKGTALLVILLILAVVLLVGIVFVEQGQRRIPVQFAKRVVGRRMYGGQSTYIPLKVNQSGVIPIIFASSVLYLPILLTNVLPAHGWGGHVQSWISGNLATPDKPVYVVVYGLLIVGLRVLLHGHRLRPRPAGGEHPQAGRVHPRHPPRAPDRALPQPDPHPHHAPGRPVHRLHRPAAVDPARRRQRPALPVRGHLDPHRGGRGPGDDEADRQPADDAQLRGVPEVTGCRPRCVR